MFKKAIFKKISFLILLFAVSINIISCSSSVSSVKVSDEEKTVKKSDELEIVSFGYKYVNGEKVDLKWIVLDSKKDQKLLFAREYVADKPFNLSDWFKETTWSNSTLRAWLNTTFLIEHFDAEDQMKIVETDVTNEDIVLWEGTKSEYRIDAGGNTLDKVFILSNDEIKKYAEGHEGPFQTGRYWTRTPVSNVDSKYEWSVMGSRVGSIDDHHVRVPSQVRPAMWVKY